MDRTGHIVAGISNQLLHRHNNNNKWQAADQHGQLYGCIFRIGYRSSRAGDIDSIGLPVGFGANDNLCCVYFVVFPYYAHGIIAPASRYFGWHCVASL